MPFETAALSDIGKVRSENEDRYLHDPQRALFAVADGIGGLPGGAEAAQAAIDALVPAADQSAPDEIDALYQAAQAAVLELGRHLSPDFGIGTTLCLGRFHENHLHLGNIGDSRCYRLRDRELACLTEDHSVENDVMRRRARGENVPLLESQRHALTQCIGQPMELDIAATRLTTRPGDLYLFATDGITRALSDQELAQELLAERPVEETLRTLLALASERGGRDNATGILVRVLA